MNAIETSRYINIFRKINVLELARGGYHVELNPNGESRRCGRTSLQFYSHIEPVTFDNISEKNK